MSYKLIITEKPSVAKDIANVIGAKTRREGYIEGNGYRVTWAVGHLVGLAEPEEYGYVPQKEMYMDDNSREIAYSQLPLLPQEFKLVVLENTKDQFEIVKNLMLSDENEQLISAGDMGNEGHILQWLIRVKAGYTKPFLQFCATSMTEEAISHAIKHLRKGEEFSNIIKGEFCKKKADWIMGMSLSRAESLKYKTNITVGRVQSPTLYFVVSRYLEVVKFKVTNYYGMDVSLEEGFHVFWNKDTQGIFPQSDKDSMGRVLNKKAIEGKIAEIKSNGTGIVTGLQMDKKGQNRPQLFDITELEREANRKYGYSPALTLANAQCLYESHKVTTYPRTDSRYLTSDLKPYLTNRIKAISTVVNGNENMKSCVEDLLKAGLNIDNKIVDDSKVTDHHAIIVTEKIANFDYAKLLPVTKKDKDSHVTHDTLVNILNLILARMIVAFSQPYYYEQTSVEVTFGNAKFTASGNKPIQLGWKSVQDKLLGKAEEEKNGEEDAEQIFPNIKKGQVVNVDMCNVLSKKTTPPKLHTEATLLTAMENAGATIENGAILKGRGIGTQATRAEIIKNLFDRNYCEMQKKGKTNYIVPTKTGLTIIKVLPQELYSPKITADWETKISLIAEGKMSEKEFMDDFTDFIREKVEEVKSAELKVSFKKEREVFGICPWCGESIYKWEDKEKNRTSFYCSNEECSCRIDSDNITAKMWTGKELTESQMIHLLVKGIISLKVNPKDGGTPYKLGFSLVEKEVGDKVYCNLEPRRQDKTSNSKYGKKETGGKRRII